MIPSEAKWDFPLDYLPIPSLRFILDKRSSKPMSKIIPRQPTDYFGPMVR
jgi:hypothetical protein